MSEKPQETRGDEQEDLLEQIITRGLEKLNEPAQAQTESETPADETPPVPKPADSGETALPAGRKNRRSSVYLYLLVLFGAAFLMLLLAYFIQQRSNENTISDLRDSMNLSRTELLDEIRELEEQNEALNGELDRLKTDQQAYEKQVEEEIRRWGQDYTDAMEKLYAWNSFWELEQYYQAGDLQSCAAILILRGQGQYLYSTPDSARIREAEIVQAVIDAGILDKDYNLNPGNYEELLTAYFDKIGISIEGMQQWPDTVQWSITKIG